MVERKELLERDIARRAYELYLERDREPGKDVEDWARAETELSSEVRVESVKVQAAQAGRN